MLARAGGNDVQGIDLIAMSRRRLSWRTSPVRLLLRLVVVGLVLAVPARALAADPKVEKEAQALQQKAIQEDNLNVNYAGAIKKLQSAIAKCDGDKCNSSLKASLLRDLGAMQILNGAVDDGKASFGQAIGMDGSIELDPAYKNPQLEGIWAEVKKSGGGGGGAPLKAGPQPTGDFVHSPPTEALVRTPLPVYVEYSGNEELARVTVKYKGYGMPDWKTIELKKGDSGYGALIPCKDVTQGMMQYYVQGFNGQNDSVAASGTKSKPFTVPVNAQISGPAPSLPGEEPPAQCQDSGECPPDFPGCGAKKKAGGEDCTKDEDCDSNSCQDDKCVDKKGTGDDCAKDDECNSGTCTSGKCAGKKAEGEECDADEDCDSDKCSEGKCTASSSSSGKPPRLWIGVGAQADIYFLPGANDVCIVDPNSGNPTNSAGYSCVDPSSGNAFPAEGVKSLNLSGRATNSDIIQGSHDQVVGGTKLGNIRIFLSLDYALSQNVLVGIRAGYVLGTDPNSPPFPPIHLEARLTYLIGKDAVSKPGIAPMLFAGVGAGEFDAYVPVQVDLNAGSPPPHSTENAWLTGGPVFFSVGGGARALISRKVAFTAGLKFEGAIGGAAGFLPGIAPELGLQFGL
jgi:hypothetical protein